MCYIYHISRPGMNISEGYIGISNNPNKRWNRHKNSGDNPHLKNALEKYSDIQFKILCKYSTIEEALRLEKAFRPTENIGWNIAVGGGKPPVKYGKDNKGTPPSRKGAKHSEESKALMREANIGRTPPNKGKKCPEQSGENHASKKEKNMRTCKHCNKTMYVAQHNQWHGDNCKLSGGVSL